jgi:hypothetical protein
MLALGLEEIARDDALGWKRILVTVGEKIGKQHLIYGQ